MAPSRAHWWDDILWHVGDIFRNAFRQKYYNDKVGSLRMISNLGQGLLICTDGVLEGLCQYHQRGLIRHHPITCV